MARPAAALVLFGWMLLSSRDPDAPPEAWQAVGSYDDKWVCDHARSAEVDRATQMEIGSALAGQPPDNPLRREAYRRAEARVRPRFRCERE